ncbi:hypothetical protein SAMN05421786_107204 [Chryseobacterium ureilyticum]|uniref:DUF6705 domain-containing protein n=1 Tax=Chryseobacterium ureilyticum TaxID=373668 RepID=A0A1N7Q4F6_9FLAO|nr:DUF6705 family protein [Chryseobacterium ureilyticum]SIT17696.1 hypothetical protein SAMN05421786_107204 [Chryseobacterium ureilyticum]
MRNVWIIVGIFVVFSCKAQQQVLPLNTSVLGAPENSYFKDLNNELDYYEGTWNATFQDKTIVLQISEQKKASIELFDKNFYRDQLFIRYEITKNGIISESTLNKDFTNDVGLSIKSAYTQDNRNNVTLLFSGGNCSVGIGTINLKKINATQFSWGYYPGTTTRIDTLCPPDREYKIHLPETENLIFTKQ